jgi:hypothetical protein
MVRGRHERRLRELRLQHSLDDALAILKREDTDIINVIAAVRIVERVNVKEARRRVFDSSAWAESEAVYDKMLLDLLADIDAQCANPMRYSSPSN